MSIASQVGSLFVAGIAMDPWNAGTITSTNAPLAELNATQAATFVSYLRAAFASAHGDRPWIIIDASIPDGDVRVDRPACLTQQCLSELLCGCLAGCGVRRGEGARGNAELAVTRSRWLGRCAVSGVKRAHKLFLLTRLHSTSRQRQSEGAPSLDPQP